MHAEPPSATEHPVGIASGTSLLATATGLGLFSLTLAGEAMLGAGARWLAAYLGAMTLGLFVSPGIGAGELALFVAAVPLAWSVVGLLHPGRGRGWRRRLGARRPSAEEDEMIGEALGLLDAADLRGLPRCYVLDDPLPGAAVRGGVLIVNRGLLDLEALPAVLAHELGHAVSFDGRLTEALARLIIWRPLIPSVEAAQQAPAQLEDSEPGGFFWSVLRLWGRVAAGGRAEALLRPFWAAYWRSREYAADAYAAELGEGEDLARYLADHELALDLPHRRRLFDCAEHPPVAHRLERLAALAPGGGSK
ncbi:MAG TPA: M48 family metalloprotease [Solirubrobacterales bacterium]|jgi:Zn-dependent protease with chaperone function|nr:M48 family metalloprotease [Solirubrobacterales bacterium]